MLYVKLAGVHPQLDGDYPLDGTSFTNRELRTIKRMAGVRAGELSEAFEKGDNDLLVAFASIALTRAKKAFVEEVLWEAAGGAIDFEEIEEKSDAGPPQTPRSSGGSSEPSGDASSNASELSPQTSNQKPFGAPV